MGHKPNIKLELDAALGDTTHAQHLLKQLLDMESNNKNKQMLQATLSRVNQAVDATRTSAYGTSIK